MWLLWLFLGSAESQLQLPWNNFTNECNIPGNFMCSNGRCIPGAWQCDGLPDCFDESDEKECPKAKSKCGSTFFPCSSGIHCIIGRFRCNGFEDCPDGSDEENCTANPLLCSTDRFHCRNGLCIDKSFMCDNQNNCQDNSDEESCGNSHVFINCRKLVVKHTNGGHVTAGDFNSHKCEDWFQIWGKGVTCHKSEQQLNKALEADSNQNYVTTEPQLIFYPSVTYAIIGSSAIFVLVVALLALILHHQRKRNNLMTLPVHRLQHPVLLSRLVVLDHPHQCNVTYNVNNGVQYMSTQGYHRPPDLDSPPSYSEAVLDQSRPPWFDLPPPPYSSETGSRNHLDLPPYRSQTGSVISTDASEARGPETLDSSPSRNLFTNTGHHSTLCEITAEQSDSLINSVSI